MAPYLPHRQHLPKRTPSSWESTETAFVSVCKGLAFVIVSAIVLYWRMRKTIGGLERTRRDLAEVQERFHRAIHRAIVDAPIPVSIFAEDGQIVLLNRAWLEITGYQADELQTVDNWIEKAYGDRRASIEKLIHKLFSLNDRLNEDGI